MLLNVCEAVPPETGKIDVPLREGKVEVEIRIVDNGPGVAEPIRKKLFQPFVSYGKQNGIGLDLAISQKIIQDRGGNACLQTTEPGETVFRLTLPTAISEEEVLSR